MLLPPVATPVAAYTPAIALAGEGGILVRTSGQIPVVDGELVGAEVSPQDAYRAAQVCALNALAAGAEVAGGVDQLERVLKVTVFVASAPTFTGQASVANGASDTFGKLFDQPHIRSAVGVAALPLGAPCEVEVEFLARS